MKLSNASKNCLKSLSKQLLARKDICPFLVLRVSLRCLIYKVHTANRGGSFIVPQPKPSCQHLFSNFFEILCQVFRVIPALSLVPLSLASALADPAQVPPRSGARLYYHPPTPLSTPFLTFFKVFFGTQYLSAWCGQKATKISVAPETKL